MLAEHSCEDEEWCPHKERAYGICLDCGKDSVDCEEWCLHHEHDHGICIDCGKDILETLIPDFED